MNRQNYNYRNILKFIDFSSICRMDEGNQRFSIRKFYKYHENNLETDVFTRKQKNERFTTEEMTNLFYDLIGACYFL